MSLKARLYEFHYPAVPLRRILLDGKSNKEYANEVREIIDLVVYRPPTDSQSGFLEFVNRFRSFFLDSLFEILNQIKQVHLNFLFDRWNDPDSF
jgi:hypothetical protein